MWRVLRIIFVLSSLGFFIVASAQLPPEIMVDKHLIEAEQLLEKKDYAEAFKVMEKIIALQKEHNLALPDEFHFKYARVALSVDSLKVALESFNKYLSATGKEGEFYEDALLLLVETEKHLSQYKVTPENTCSGNPELNYCWKELANHPKCYFWLTKDDDYNPHWIANWSDNCLDSLAQGNGILTLQYEDNDGTLRKVFELSGQIVRGEFQGEWVVQSFSHSGSIYEKEEGVYENSIKQGVWITRWPDGDVWEIPYVDGVGNGQQVLRLANGGVLEGPIVDNKKHGDWVERYSNGRVCEGPYVNGLAHGKWVCQETDGRTKTIIFVNGEPQN